MKKKNILITIILGLCPLLFVACEDRHEHELDFYIGNYYRDLEFKLIKFRDTTYADYIIVSCDGRGLYTQKEEWRIACSDYPPTMCPYKKLSHGWYLTRWEHLFFGAGTEQYMINVRWEDVDSYSPVPVNCQYVLDEMQPPYYVIPLPVSECYRIGTDDLNEYLGFTIEDKLQEGEKGDSIFNAWYKDGLEWFSVPGCIHRDSLLFTQIQKTGEFYEQVIADLTETGEIFQFAHKDNINFGYGLCDDRYKLQ